LTHGFSDSGVFPLGILDQAEPTSPIDAGVLWLTKFLLGFFDQHDMAYTNTARGQVVATFGLLSNTCHKWRQANYQKKVKKGGVTRI